MSKIEKSILQTLSFFDIFQRPLSLEELWQYLFKIKAGKLQVLFALRKLQKKSIVYEKNDYFSLSKDGFKKFFENRTLCWQRLERAKKIVKYLQWLPFVKHISVINSLAFTASDNDSDIDILLITNKNRLWTSRALVVAFLELIGQNKNKWFTANKFCLGFAFDEECLDLSKLRLKSLVDSDIYFTYWLATLVPIYDQNIYEKLISENEWIFSQLPNWTPRQVERVRNQKTFFEKILSGSFGKKLEKILSDIQIKKIWSDPENYRDGASVIADSKMMKLHAYDTRARDYQMWQEKIKSVILGVDKNSKI